MIAGSGPTDLSCGTLRFCCLDPCANSCAVVDPWIILPACSAISLLFLSAAKLDLELEPIDKWEFYKAASTADHVLTIQTADQQRFANLLLTIGVRMD